MNEDSSDSPRLSPRAAHRTEPKDAPEVFGSSPAAVLLRNFIRVSREMPEPTDPDYASALKDLRDNAEEVTIEIARSERACVPRDYPTRWSLVFTASEMRHPATMPFLRTLVKTPIPSEASEDPHSLSTVAEETIIRTTAVDAVASLAKGGSRPAFAALMEFLEIPSFSIRRAAVHGLLGTARGKRMARAIADRLPADQRFILNLKRIEDVREVPQVKDPRKHLKATASVSGQLPKPHLGPIDKDTTIKKRKEP